jgi:hypothetical protein
MMRRFFVAGNAYPSHYPFGANHRAIAISLTFFGSDMTASIVSLSAWV